MSLLFPPSTSETVTTVHSIKFWPAARWGVIVRESGQERWQELHQPFALIGSDERCDVVIPERRLPPVVYLAVLYGERIELWPLCAIAFPVWGPIKGKPQVMVGKSKVRFVREGEPKWPSALLNRPGDAINEVEALRLAAPRPNASLAMDWGTGTQMKPINRPVSILGEGHPSLIRLHGVGLRTCELGLICAGNQMWAIQLNPDALSPGEPLIRQISDGGTSILVGSLHLWCNRAGEKAAEPFGTLLEYPIHDGTPEAETELETSPIQQNEAEMTAKLPPSSVDAFAKHGPTVDADEFSTTFTDRLLEKGGRRAFRESLVKWSVVAVLVFCALFAVGYILIRGILPIVDAIYTE